jgi:probable DNA metabolism protein
MISVSIENNFNSWRSAARSLLQAGVAPEAVLWKQAGENNLFENEPLPESKERNFSVPRKFVEIVQMAACFDADERWGLFYRLLFRLVHENKDLMEIESDEDVRQAMLMRKAVARDIHKTHAFVRFREIGEIGRIECDDKKVFVAWHEPHHFTVELSTPFFARRFGSMRWSILTPKGCAHWDLKELTFSESATRDMAPKGDISEDMWLTYYRSIFNPFRLKVKMMKKEMPVRHWRTLPEAQLIPELIRQAKMSD